MKNLFIVLFLSFQAVQSGRDGRLLVDDFIYKNNERRCNEVYITILTGEIKHVSKTQDAKIVCDNLDASCCSKKEIDLLVAKMKPAQEELRKQMAYIAGFLEFCNSLDAEALIKNIPPEIWKEVEAETPDEQQPLLDAKKKPLPDDKQQQIRKQRAEQKRKDFEKSIREMPIQNGMIQANLNIYFNEVSKNYSGLICSACDSRFSHFLSVEGKMLISKEQCTDYLKNQGHLLSLALNLGTLVGVANKVGGAADERFTYANFKRKLREVQDRMEPCEESDEQDEDMTDSQIEKLNESKLSADDGVTVAATSRYLQRCADICKKSLPTNPYEISMGIIETMQYIMATLRPLAKKPQLADQPAPSKEPIVFFESAARPSQAEIDISPTALYFSSFPVNVKLYQIFEIKPVVYQPPNINEVIPKIPLTFWQKLFNVLFGWLFGKYEEKVGVE